MEASRSSSIADRARSQPEATEDDQAGLFDRVVENDVLERALERRKAQKKKLDEAKKNYENADDAAKGMVAELEIGEEEVVRVGRFKVRNIKYAGGAEVSYTISERLQLSISEIKD